jgi:hypothetical protein
MQNFGWKTSREETNRRRRHRWLDNIRNDFRETVWECMDWMHMAQDRDQWRAVLNTLMKLRFP